METILAIHGCMPHISFSLMGVSFSHYGGDFFPPLEAMM